MKIQEYVVIYTENLQVCYWRKDFLYVEAPQIYKNDKEFVLTDNASYFFGLKRKEFRKEFESEIKKLRPTLDIDKVWKEFKELRKYINRLK